MAKTWQRIGWIFIATAAITVITRWNWFTMGADSQWERGVSVSIYFGLWIMCKGIHDILLKMEERE